MLWYACVFLVHFDIAGLLLKTKYWYGKLDNLHVYVHVYMYINTQT